MPEGRYAPVPGKIPGTPLNLGGVEFVAPPFNLDGVQQAIPLLERAAKLNGDATAAIELAADVLLISLRRNYPDLKREELLQLVDTGNAAPSLLALCKVSGIEFKSGEARPASP